MDQSREISGWAVTASYNIDILFLPIIGSAAPILRQYATFLVKFFQTNRALDRQTLNRYFTLQIKSSCKVDTRISQCQGFVITYKFVWRVCNHKTWTL